LSHGRQNKEKLHFSFFSTKIIFKKEGVGGLKREKLVSRYDWVLEWKELEATE